MRVLVQWILALTVSAIVMGFVLASAARAAEAPPPGRYVSHFVVVP